MRKPIQRAGLLGGLALLPMSVAVAAEPGVNALNYPGPAWSPYVVGAGIGVLSWLTFYVSDHPIGASTFYAQLAGFLLQKGGVGKFNVLIGQLLLQDFTVAKVMLTAIVLGMVGVLTLHHFGKVKLHIKPTRIGANVIGGLLFGAGFALLGYCPGTAAVALGQGSWDALFGMAGLVAGSWIFAELSGWSKRTVESWGDRGKVLLPDLLHLPHTAFAIGLAAALITLILVLERFTIR